MKIEIRKSAVKDLKKISEPHKTKIKERVKDLQNYPDITNIKKLVNFDPKYRLRVGDYRILFDISGDTIYIARIRHRRESY